MNGAKVDRLIVDEAQRMGEPRPLEAQTWRRHHTGRATADPMPSRTSGCQRRRRKAIERRARLMATQIRDDNERAARLIVAALEYETSGFNIASEVHRQFNA